MRIHLVAALVIVAFGFLAAGAQTAPSALQHLTLLDAKAVDAVERGEAVTVTIDAPEKTEIATLGVVRLEVPRAFYVEHVKQLAGFLATGTTWQSGTFGEPARLDDVSTLSLNASDAKALAKCQPLKCDVKLPAQEMERFRVVLEKTARDARHDVDGIRNTSIAGPVGWKPSPIRVSPDFLPSSASLCAPGRANSRGASGHRSA